MKKRMRPLQKIRVPAWTVGRLKLPAAEVGPEDFALAVYGACSRYHEAYQRWAKKRVRFDPKFMAADQKDHQRLWDEMQCAKEEISDLAVGLLGQHPAPSLNDRALKALPDLLDAAEKRLLGKVP